MSTEVETIRRAAALMRERAEAAESGPWHDVKMGSEGSVVLNEGTTIITGRKAATCREFADAEHIASWHPAVALAVADWMDEIVRLTEKYDFPEDASDLLRPAFAVARTYLGESA